SAVLFTNMFLLHDGVVKYLLTTLFHEHLQLPAVGILFLTIYLFAKSVRDISDSALYIRIHNEFKFVDNNVKSEDIKNISENLKMLPSIQKSIDDLSHSESPREVKTLRR